MQDDVDMEVFLTTFEIKFLLGEKFLPTTYIWWTAASQICLKKKVVMQDDVDMEVFLTTFEIKFLLGEKFLTAT